nr:cca trna nucleotidyltransferase, mitochondrial [Quercus suber]
MNATRTKLSHLTSRTDRISVICKGCIPYNVPRCPRSFCKSPARLLPTSPEGQKWLKLKSVSASSFNSTPTMVPALIQEIEDDRQEPPTTLNLTLVEKTLRRLLLDVAEYIDESPLATDNADLAVLPEVLANEKLTLRFTGGWVRDKLLDVPSHDIDVAINKMTGEKFGLKMKEYLEIPGNPEKYGLEGVAITDKQSQTAGTTDKSKLVGGLHKIEANPEKSKHLETVATRILGLDIDLVNLRKETYSSDSRNPQMEFGTAQEDAMRRDATVNAMFYNINTEVIEDFTGKGHDDMRKKIIRTPLEPYQTFDDDPLRVLRLIRFASRLGYTIEDAALRAMTNRDIQDALRRKISRERIGIEMEKCLRGPDPHEALRLVFQLGLYETIFSDPTVAAADQYTPDTIGWQAAIDTLEDLISADRNVAQLLIRDPEERFMAWQLLAFVPYRDAPQTNAPPGRKPPPPVATSVAREGVKATNRVCDVVSAAVRNQSHIAHLVDQLYQQQRRPDQQKGGEDATARDTIGMAIRKWGPTWRSQVVFSFLAEVMEGAEIANLLESYALKPLIDGTSLAKALNTAPGPWMKDALDVVMAWQLRNPGATDSTLAIAEVKQAKGELTSSLIHHFLKLTIRPLFSKRQPSNVTETGRKVTTDMLPKKMTLQDDQEVPWKRNTAHAFELLQWVASRLDAETLEEVWPLIVPPVLTLVDDLDVEYKLRGIRFLRQILAVTPPTLLARTGLGSVFEDALTPCFSYLPDMTPENESLTLLKEVYPTLLVLSTVRYSLASVGLYSSQSPRVKYLDGILRRGILNIYAQTSASHPRITAVLFEHLVPVLNSLGIETVRHLQYLLPMLTDTLTHPLASAEVPLLANAAKAIQAVILNAWPRMKGYRGEVLKGLTTCWLNLENANDRHAAEEVKRDLQEVVKMLKVVLREDEEVDFEVECMVLVRADARLDGLLAST